MLDFDKINLHSYTFLRDFSRTFLTTQVSLCMLTLQYKYQEWDMAFNSQQSSTPAFWVLILQVWAMMSGFVLDLKMLPAHTHSLSIFSSMPINLLVWKEHIHSSTKLGKKMCQQCPSIAQGTNCIFLVCVWETGHACRCKRTLWESWFPSAMWLSQGPSSVLKVGSKQRSLTSPLARLNPTDCTSVFSLRKGGQVPDGVGSHVLVLWFNVSHLNETF